MVLSDSHKSEAAILSRSSYSDSTYNRVIHLHKHGHDKVPRIDTIHVQQTTYDGAGLKAAVAKQGTSDLVAELVTRP